MLGYINFVKLVIIEKILASLTTFLTNTQPLFILSTLHFGTMDTKKSFRL